MEEYQAGMLPVVCLLDLIPPALELKSTSVTTSMPSGYEYQETSDQFPFIEMINIIQYQL